MNQPLLVLDSHYLCYRAFHSQTKDLSYNGVMTGIVFQFLKSISQLKDEFQTDRVAFCFESESIHRRKIYPEYKLGRHKNHTEEEKQARRDFLKQINLLQSEYLPKIGFRNIYNFAGYEADDIMAAICQHSQSEVILVTSDSDMLQCLKEGVSIYSPQKRVIYTEEWFIREYGFPPQRWALVKAIAGCSSDNVAGVPGVGEKSAIRYAQGKLKEGVYFERIMANRRIVHRNRKLVQLPFEGCPIPKIQTDQLSKKGWIETCSLLGMKSLAGRMPIASRKLAAYGRSKGFKV